MSDHTSPKPSASNSDKPQLSGARRKVGPFVDDSDSDDHVEDPTSPTQSKSKDQTANSNSSKTTAPNIEKPYTENGGSDKKRKPGEDPLPKVNTLQSVLIKRDNSAIQHLPTNAGAVKHPLKKAVRFINSPESKAEDASPLTGQKGIKRTPPSNTEERYNENGGSIKRPKGSGLSPPESANKRAVKPSASNSETPPTPAGNPPPTNTALPATKSATLTRTELNNKVATISGAILTHRQTKTLFISLTKLLSHLSSSITDITTHISPSLRGGSFETAKHMCVARHIASCAMIHKLTNLPWYPKTGDVAAVLEVDLYSAIRDVRPSMRELSEWLVGNYGTGEMNREKEVFVNICRVYEDLVGVLGQLEGEVREAMGDGKRWVNASS